MRFVNVSLVALASLSLCRFACAYLVVDDFQTGPYQVTINWPNTADGKEIKQLDKDHCAMGVRATDIHVWANPFHVPVTLSIGQGHFAVSGPPGNCDGLSSEVKIIWQDLTHPLDLSNENQIWVDLQVKNPNDRWADLWSIYVKDTNGVTGTNDGFRVRTGGIYFRKSGFVGNPDWSKIRTLWFQQRFDSQGAAHPDSYTATRIYGVTSGITEYAAETYAVERGQVSSGGVSSLVSKDDNALVVCRFLVPNQQVPPIAVRFEASIPFIPLGFWLRTETSMAFQGAFETTFELWDWMTSTYSDSVTATIGTSAQRIEVTPTDGFTRYIAADGKVRARALVKSVGPSAVSTWCVKFDQVVWQVANT